MGSTPVCYMFKGKTNTFRTYDLKAISYFDLGIVTQISRCGQNVAGQQTSTSCRCQEAPEQHQGHLPLQA